MHPIDYHNTKLQDIRRAKGLPPSRLWLGQEVMLDAWYKHDRSGGWTANTIGKTYAEAVLVLSQMLTSNCGWVISYPIRYQLKHQFWKELRTLWNVLDAVPVPGQPGEFVPVGGKILDSDMSITFGDSAYCLGISPQTVTEEHVASQRMQGYHHGDLMAVHFGEASAVQGPRWDAAVRMSPNKQSAWGNPISDDDRFAQFLNRLPAGARFQFGGQDCLNWQRKNGRVPGLVSEQSAIEYETTWAGTDIYYMGWLGKPPPKSSKAVVPYAWALACVGGVPAPSQRRVLGVDVGGREKTGDQSSITRRLGNLFDIPFYQRGVDEVRLVHEILRLLDRPAEGWPWSVRIDDTAIGHGVTDLLRASLRQLQLEALVEVVPVTFGSSASKSRQVELPSGQHASAFANIETEMYWDVRLLCQSRAASLPNDPELLRELSTRDVELDTMGRLRLESKDDYKARHSGLSPNKGDSTALAAWEGEEKRTVIDANSIIM